MTESGSINSGLARNAPGTCSSLVYRPRSVPGKKNGLVQFDLVDKLEWCRAVRVDMCRRFSFNLLQKCAFPGLSWAHGKRLWLVEEIVRLFCPVLARLLLLLHVSLVLPSRVAISCCHSSNMRENTSRIILWVDGNHIVESRLNPCTVLRLLRPVVNSQGVGELCTSLNSK